MSTASTRTTGTVTVEELRRAWHATQRGDFRTPPGAGEHDRTVAGAASQGDDSPAAARVGTSPVWSPQATEQLVTVVGCHGSTGATTVAVAIATAHSETTSGPARVVECSSAAASGLAAACSAELGEHPTGWRQGRRDQVFLERVSRVTALASEVPAPMPAEQPHEVSVLDAGWEVTQTLASDSWLAAILRDAEHLVFVTTATVPGMRRLEATLEILAAAPGAQSARVAIRGPRRKKWARPVAHAGGPQVAQVLAEGRYVEIPEDRDLAVLGLSTTALPRPLVHACGALLPNTDPSTSSPASHQHDPESEPDAGDGVGNGLGDGDGLDLF